MFDIGKQTPAFIYLFFFFQEYLDVFLDPSIEHIHREILRILVSMLDKNACPKTAKYDLSVHVYHLIGYELQLGVRLLFSYKNSS